MAVLRVKGADGTWQEIPAIIGNDGVTPDINVEVVSLPAGSTPTVTKKGTLEAPIFVLGIPAAESNSSGGSSGDTGDAIPKTGNRGILAGYETTFFDIATMESVGGMVIDKDSPDCSSFIGSASNGIRLKTKDIDMESMGFETVMDDDGNVIGIKCHTWTKVVVLLNFFGDAEVTLGANWHWKDNIVPAFSTMGLLVFQLAYILEGAVGFVSYIPLMDAGTLG